MTTDVKPVVRRRAKPPASRVSPTCGRPGSTHVRGRRAFAPSAIDAPTHLVTWCSMLLAVVRCAGSPAAPAMSRRAAADSWHQLLIKDLKAENVEVRRAAAVGIRTSPRDLQRASVPAMIDRLMKRPGRTGPAGRPRHALRPGRDAAAAVPALVHTLRTDFGGRGQEATHQDYRSALALSAIGKPAVEGLRGLLGEKKESVARGGRHGPGSKRARRRSGNPRPRSPAGRQERATQREAVVASGESARSRPDR